MRPTLRFVFLQMGLLSIPFAARAQAPGAAPAAPLASETAGPLAKHRDAQTVIEDGTFLPGTFAARIGDQHVSALAFGGYDSNASQGGTFSGVVEGALFNRVTLRVGYDYLQAPVPAEPVSAGYMSVGLRFGILRQEEHHINLGFFIQYKQKGFSESNGEIELAVTASYRWNRFGLYADLVYGQGFERQERDGEVRVSGLYTLAKRWNVGFEARSHFDLGDGVGTALPGAFPEAGFDLIAAPLVEVSFGHFAVLGEVGAHVLTLDGAGSNPGTTTAGVIALAGVATAF